MEILSSVLLESISDMFHDFGTATDLKPFWFNYAPKQRGRSPKLESVPWGEVGEKSIVAHLVRALARRFPNIAYPGLPVGADMRFMVDDALVHLDIKLTGPNDNADEIVASPYQVSGDGAGWKNKTMWEDGFTNSLVHVVGVRGGTLDFQPALPPFYVLNGTLLVCLTYYLKVVYTVNEPGDQPLEYLELVCVPNGLVMFDGLHYDMTPGLFLAGKDDKTKTENKRIRIRLSPLAQIDSWRCVKVVLEDEGWKAVARIVPIGLSTGEQRQLL
jgi:hypothetical protein